MASDDFHQDFHAVPPPHPFDEKWYVRRENETLGPYDGWRVKELIEQGQIGRSALIARVGATEWSALKDIPAFDALTANAAGRRQAVVPVGQPAAADGTLRYAGFWIRFLAYLIDYVIVNVIVLAVSGIVGLLIGLGAAWLAAEQGERPIVSDLAGVVGALIAIVIIVIYYVKFNSGPWQATPGKRMLGIHLIRVDGQPVGGWLACGRYFAYMVSALPLCLGFMSVGWNEEKKGFHDMMCGTRVIYGKL